MDTSQEIIDLHSRLTRRAETLSATSDQRYIGRVNRAVSRAGDDVVLLRAYLRLLSPTTPVESINRAVAIVRRFATDEAVESLTDQDMRSYESVTKALYLQHARVLVVGPSRDDFNQTAGWLAITHPSRIADLHTVLVDRLVTNVDDLRSMFEEMGEHHSSLTEGVL